jgi:hypothetical protein
VPGEDCGGMRGEVATIVTNTTTTMNNDNASMIMRCGGLDNGKKRLFMPYNIESKAFCGSAFPNSHVSC